MGESTHWGNAFLSQIGLRYRTVGVLGNRFTNAVNFFVDLRTVMVTALAGTRDLELHMGRMPCADARNLPQTAMRFARQTSTTPTGDNTGRTVALCSVDHINLLVLAPM